MIFSVPQIFGGADTAFPSCSSRFRRRGQSGTLRQANIAQVDVESVGLEIKDKNSTGDLSLEIDLALSIAVCRLHHIPTSRGSGVYYSTTVHR